MLPPAPAAAELMSRDLDGIADKEALMITVTYLPGGTSLPHHHDASANASQTEPASRAVVPRIVPDGRQSLRKQIESLWHSSNLAGNALPTAPTVHRSRDKISFRTQ